MFAVQHIALGDWPPAPPLEHEQARPRVPVAFMRQDVADALDVTVNVMRARVERAMRNPALLQQLFDAIQPDGTFKF